MRLVVDAPGYRAPVETDISRLGELLRDRSNRLWLDISDPGPEEVALLRREFGFHQLALDDVTRPHERPRCDAYAGYYFIVVYAAEHGEREFRPRELNLFWGENYLVTIHRRPAAVLGVLEEARRRWEQHDGREAHGVACLAYVLFESLVDGYFVVQDRIRERMEAIEEAISTAQRAPRRISSGCERSCCAYRGCWRRRVTSSPRCSAASAQFQTRCGRTSPTCRIMRRTSWPKWTRIAICSAQRSMSTSSTRSTGSVSS
jgi:Mg2+ and Co2+ transporter CorA